MVKNTLKMKQLEDLPIKVSMSRSKYRSRWCYKNNIDYKAIHKLLNGYTNREFSLFFAKVKPFLRNESHPLTWIIDRCFNDTDYQIVDGIIINTAKQEKRLPKKVIFQNNKFHLITDDSVVGNVLYVHFSRNGKKTISTSKYPSWDTTMDYDKFTDVFINNIKNTSRRHYTYGITRFSAEYYLYPATFDDNIQTYQNLLIDLHKCLVFDTEKSLKKYLTRQYIENIKKQKKIQRLVNKAKLEESNKILNVAMEKFQQRIERNKQVQIALAKLEAEKSAAIRNAHGFDETSFTTQQNRVK